jgi:hypothetical protein
MTKRERQKRRQIDKNIYSDGQRWRDTAKERERYSDRGRKTDAATDRGMQIKGRREYNRYSDKEKDSYLQR